MVRAVWAASPRGRRLYLVDDRYDFIEPVRQYLDYLDALGKTPNTLENYCRHLKAYFTFLEQVGKGWSEVGPDDLVEFILWLRNPSRKVGVMPLRGVSPLTERTINTMIAAVGSFYRYHGQRGERVSNPVVYEQFPDRFSGFKGFLVHTSRGKALRRSLKLKEPRKRVKTIKEDEFRTFVQSIDNHQFKCLVFLLHDGGLRIGEALGLCIQDVDYARNGVWIRRRNDLDNGALAKGMVEGEERFVDLSRDVMVLLDKLILKHNFDTDHLFVVTKKNSKDRFSQATYGKPLNRDAVKSLFRHYSEKSGVRLHAHMLRHTHATDLIRAGWDASYVQKRVGHRNVQTTINTYVHLNDEDLAAKWREYQEAQSRGPQSERKDSNHKV